MKKSILGLVAISALFAAPAMAADMSMPVKAPYAPPPPVYSWTGFYLNAGGGYGLWAADTTTVNPVTGVCILCATQTQGGKGWLGRLGGGFDYQIGSRFVLGAFADWDPESLKGTIQDQTPFFAGNITEDWSWAAGARLGWLAAPQVLTYVNGGFTETHFNSAAMFETHLGAATTFSTPAFSTDGWFIGGGVESSLSSLIPGLPSGLFWRTEYRYAQFDSKTLPDCPTVGVCASSITFKPSNQTVVSELVWRFNFGGR